MDEKEFGSIKGWFAGRLPDGWFSGVEVTLEDDQIVVLGALPASAAQVSNENGCGTHGLRRSVEYSTTIRRPPGLSIDRTASSTGFLLRTKCSELAMTTPSRSCSDIGRVKSAATTSTVVSG